MVCLQVVAALSVPKLVCQPGLAGQVCLQVLAVLSMFMSCQSQGADSCVLQDSVTPQGQQQQQAGAAHAATPWQPAAAHPDSACRCWTPACGRQAAQAKAALSPLRTILGVTLPHSGTCKVVAYIFMYVLGPG